MSHPHPAINAHLASISCAQNGQKEQWLSLFADDALVHDPVGPSPHDPTGEGFTGKERLKEFWDLMIGPSTMVITSHKQIAAGPAMRLYCDSDQPSGRRPEYRHRNDRYVSGE